jgi:hypothetical protein
MKQKIVIVVVALVGLSPEQSTLELGCPLFEYFFWKIIHYSNNFLTEYSNNNFYLINHIKM